MLRTILISVLAAGSFVPHANAQTAHDHAAMTHVSVVPSEPGQGAFASVAEIVVLLMADPKTDWAHVDFNALRGHLIDMDMVVTHADVRTQHIAGGAIF